MLGVLCRRNGDSVLVGFGLGRLCVRRRWFVSSLMSGIRSVFEEKGDEFVVNRLGKVTKGMEV